MEKKILSLPTNENKIYSQVLVFLNFMLNLSDQERNVLAQIIRLNNEYESLPAVKRAKFILSTDMRKEMCDVLDINISHFAVVLSGIKKKTFLGKNLILDKDNVVHPYLMFKPDEEGFKIEVIINKVDTLPIQEEKESNNDLKDIEEVNDSNINTEKERPLINSGAEGTYVEGEGLEIVLTNPE